MEDSAEKVDMDELIFIYFYFILFYLLFKGKSTAY